MYRDKDLQDGLLSLVGFRQNNNPDYPTLNDELLVSESGKYVQDEHPLLTIENMDQAFKNYDRVNYPAYDNAEEYEVGDKVRATDDKIYIAIDATQGNNPTAGGSPDYWEIYNELTAKLEQIKRGAITKVTSEIFTDKKLREVTKSIFDNVQLFDGAGSMLNKEIKAGRFVGLQIVLESHRDLITVVKRLGVQFTLANPSLNIYLFHSSQEQPIAVFNIATTRVNSFEWIRLLDEDGNELTLKYLSDDYAPGGAFYLGYYEDDLAGQAINKGYDFGKAPQCSHCNNDYRYYNAWSNYISVTPIEVPASALVGKLPEDEGGPLLWDIAYNSYQYTKNYGLNLDLTVRCDLTEFFIRERYLFSDAVLKQITVDILKAIAFSTRNNPIAKEVRDLAIYSLNNRDNNTPGLEKKLEQAIKAISFDLSDLNSACLPCNDRGDLVSYGSI